MTRAVRVGVIFLVAIAAVAALVLHAPIPQPESYHSFADTRTFGWLPNTLNVLSNLPFLFVGLLGLSFLGRGPNRDPDAPTRAGPHTAFVSYRERPAYVLFFAGIFLTAFGSGFYHLQPTTNRLFWDRLPMTIAFMSLFATVIAERIDVRWSRVLLLPLIFFGVASAVMWIVSEQRGAGDLRAYIFVQGFPMIALPLLMLLFPANYTRSAELLVVVLFYVSAKALEVLDAEIYKVLGGLVSGHSLKHVAAAIASYGILDMLKHRRRLAPVDLSP